MATPRFRAQVTLQRRGLLPEDQVVNVLHFEGDEDLGQSDRDRWDGLAPGLASRLETFYVAIGGLLASSLNGDATVTLYDMRDPLPRIPRHEHAFTFAPSATALPAEVALCLSFAGEKEAGAVMARRRGRIYLGPLGNAIGNPAVSTSDYRPLSNQVGAIMTAALAMAVGTDGAARLAIYSPTTAAGAGGSDASFEDAVTMWIDDSFDTQRRRGARTSSRVLGTIGA